jgi:hypothetical protein
MGNYSSLTNPSLLLLLIFFPLSLILWSGVFMTEKKAQEILHEFYTEIGPEVVIGHQLREAGRPIVPYVLREVQKKDMPRREYAILSLGRINDRRALPILENILQDKSESDYIRGDALRAIWHMDRELGKALARDYKGECVYIDRIIGLLREGKIDLGAIYSDEGKINWESVLGKW